MSDSPVFEVSTDSCDAARARISVRGELTAANVTLLVSAVTAHLRNDRRYLRIDLGGASTTDQLVLDVVTELHAEVGRAGGMVVFEGCSIADPLGAHAIALHATG